jgi:hypothetical protein
MQPLQPPLNSTNLMKKATTMKKAAAILRLLPRAALILALLGAPVFAVPAVRGSAGPTIEAPAQKNSGAGFVLLLSLQRTSGT